MIKFLIAFYMGVVAGNDSHAQGPNYGNYRSAEVRDGEPEDDSSLGWPVLNPWMAVLPIRNTRKPEREPHRD
jgi:hypothetical protein